MKKIRKNRSLFLFASFFIFGFILVFFILTLAYKNHIGAYKDSQVISRSREIRMYLHRLSYSLQTSEIERINHHYSPGQFSNDQLALQKKMADSLLQKMSLEFANDQVQMKNFLVLKKLIEEHHSIIRHSVEQMGENAFPSEIDSIHVQSLLVQKKFERQVAKMEEYEENLLSIYNDDFVFKQKLSPLYIFIIAMLSFILLIVSFIYLLREFNRQKRINSQLAVSLETMDLAEEIGDHGIWKLDVEKNTFDFSNNLYRILKYEPGEYLPSYARALKNIYPDDRVLFEEKFTSLLENGFLLPYTYRVVRKDGKIRYFQSAGKTMIDTFGRKHIIGVTTDITSEVQSKLDIEASNEILKEQNRYLSIINEAFEEAERIGRFGTWEWFVDENTYHFSDNLLKIYGLYGEGNTVDIETLISLTLPEDRSLINRKILKMFAHTPTLPFVYRIERKNDGVVRYLSVNSKFIDDDPLMGSYLMVIVRDVTLEEQRQRRLEEQNRTLEANNRELETFNYVASHDLQEPLRKIETFISRLRSEDEHHFSESKKRIIEKIAISASRMRKLIDDLLQFSRNTRLEKQRTSTDLNVILQSALDELKILIKNKNATIESEELPIILGVEFQMLQLFINLIGNSLKYGHPERAPHINISSQAFFVTKDKPVSNLVPGKYHQLIFKDNGIGFEPQYAEKIFTLFHRLHGKLEYEGTGIGLAICKKIVENHKGKIWAEGNPGKGSQFFVVLPA